MRHRTNMQKNYVRHRAKCGGETGAFMFGTCFFLSSELQQFSFFWRMILSCRVKFVSCQQVHNRITAVKEPATLAYDVRGLYLFRNKTGERLHKSN